MKRKFSPSVYLLGFVLACATLIIVRTPSSPEQAYALAREASQKLLNDYDAIRPGITTHGEFVGIGKNRPDTTLHVMRKHPDILKVENGSQNGGSWVFQVGGNNWQDGNLLIKNATTHKHGLVIEPSGKVVVMGDMLVRGKLTSAQPPNPPPAPQPAPPPKPAQDEKVEALTKMVESLLERVAELEAKQRKPASKK